MIFNFTQEISSFQKVFFKAFKDGIKNCNV